jgi:tryptophan synthase beta subunit
VICLSGRGDKDVEHVAALKGVALQGRRTGTT